MEGYRVRYNVPAVATEAASSPHTADPSVPPKGMRVSSCIQGVNIARGVLSGYAPSRNHLDLPLQRECRFYGPSNLFHRRYGVRSPTKPEGPWGEMREDRERARGLNARE